MNLKKLQDAAPSRSWKGTFTGGLTEGNPTQQNLNDFKQFVESNAPKMMSEGMVKVKGNVCLGVKVELPQSITVKSSKEPLILIGAVEKDNNLIGYYKPKNGWKQATKAAELQ